MICGWASPTVATAPAVVLTAAVLLEKAWRLGERLAQAIGAGLILLAPRSTVRLHQAGSGGIAAAARRRSAARTAGAKLDHANQRGTSRRTAGIPSIARRSARFA